MIEQAYRKVKNIHRSGLAADKPNAADVLEGTLYFSTDAGTLERSNGTTWENYAPTGGAAPSQDLTAGTLVGRGSDSGDGPAEEVTTGDYISVVGDVVDVAGAGLTPFIVQNLDPVRQELGKAPVNYLPRAQETGKLASGYVKVTTGSGVLSSVPTVPVDAHAPTHMTAGDDPVNLTGLAGFPNTTIHFLRGDRSFAKPDGGIPAVHHTTHEPGGSDALVNAAWLNQENNFTGDLKVNKAAPELVLNENSQPVDARKFRIICGGQNFYIQAVNDAENVAPGAISMNRAGIVNIPAGLDVATPLNANSLAGGTVPDARLSTNVQMKPIGAADLPATVAYKNTTNQFTIRQRLSNAGGDLARITFTDITGAVDSKVWEILNYNGNFTIWSLNDAENAIQGSISIDKGGNFHSGGGIYSSGSIYERGRAVPMGEWTDFAMGLASDTGSVVVNNSYTSKYSLLGKSIIISIYLGIAITGTPSVLYFANPVGVAFAGYTAYPLTIQSTTGVGLMQAQGDGYIRIYYQPNGAPWPASSQVISSTGIFPLV